MSSLYSHAEMFQASRAPILFATINDARRFVLTNRQIIGDAPLQAYGSALIFNPQDSITGINHSTLFPAWTSNRPLMEKGWNQCLQTLEGHSDSVTSVAFSRDGTRIASGSDDATVKLWDAIIGTLQDTLKGHSSSVYSIAFSQDSTRIASGSGDKTVKLWDATTMKLIGSWDFKQPIYDVSFSKNGSKLCTSTGDIELNSASNVILAEKIDTRLTIRRDHDWILANGERILWLPPGYRSGSTNICANTIALINSKNRIVCISFSPSYITTILVSITPL